MIFNILRQLYKFLLAKLYIKFLCINWTYKVRLYIKILLLQTISSLAYELIPSCQNIRTNRINQLSRFKQKSLWITHLLVW